MREYTEEIYKKYIQFSSVQHARPPSSSLTPWVYSDTCPLNQWCHSAISSFLVSFSSHHLSHHQGLFKLVSSLHQVAKVLEFQLQLSPSNKYLGLIFFRMDWLVLLAVQWTLKSLLKHHSSKAPIRQCSAFFIVQLSHPYMNTGKTTALSR